MSGGRSESVDVQKSQDIIVMPPKYGEQEVVKTKTIVERREVSPASTHHGHSRSRSTGGAVIVDARPTEYVEAPAPPPIGQMALVPTDRQLVKDERAIRAEIKALEAEKEALRAEKKANSEMRRAERIRREGRESDELVVYDREEIRQTHERSRSRANSVRIEKDKKGRMTISLPKR